MVELEPDGIDVDGVAALIDGGRRAEARAHHPQLPEPRRLHAERAKREALLALAREHGFMIFEDDPYVSIRFAGDPLPTMLSLDRDGQRRLRVLVLEDGVPGHPRRLPRRPGRAHRPHRQARDEHVHQPEHGGPGDRPRVLPSGALQRSIETVRTNLKARVDALVAALERDLPDARFVAPEGGYFMWVELPEGTDVDKLFAAAGERGVKFVKGSDFLLEGGRNTLRLAYSGVTPEQIEEGVGRLAEAYNSLSGAPAAA